MVCSEDLHGELSLPLQEGGIGSDELLRLDVLNSNTTHFVGFAGIKGLVGRRCWSLVECVVEVAGQTCMSIFVRLWLANARVGSRSTSARRKWVRGPWPTRITLYEMDEYHDCLESY